MCSISQEEPPTGVVSVSHGMGTAGCTVSKRGGPSDEGRRPAEYAERSVRPPSAEGLPKEGYALSAASGLRARRASRRKARCFWHQSECPNITRASYRSRRVKMRSAHSDRTVTGRAVLVHKVLGAIKAPIGARGTFGTGHWARNHELPHNTRCIADRQYL